MSDNYLLQQKTLVNELEKAFTEGTFKSTVVDLQKDYVNDDKICLTSVVFIPTDVAEIIKEKIIEPLRLLEPSFYFFPPESLHLTIKNVRTINNPPLFNAADVEKVNALFSKIIPSFPSFDFAVEDVVLFPTSFSVMAYSNEILKDLVLSLDSGLKEIGVPDNKKYISDSVFWGNITICRYTQKPSQEFIEAVKKLRNLKLGRIQVDKINLIVSNVVLHPDSKKIIAEYNLNYENKKSL